MDKMMQCCPKCGRWLETKRKGFLERGVRKIKETLELEKSKVLGQISGDELDKIVRKSDANTGAYLGYIGLINAPIDVPLEAIAGKRYRFVCPCGNKWGTDDDSDDRTNGFREWQAKEERKKEYNQQIHSFQELLVESLGSKKPINVGTVNEMRTLLQDIREDELLVFERSLLDCLAVTYYTLGDTAKATEAIDDSLVLFNDDDNSHIIKGMIAGEGTNAEQTKNSINELLHFYAPEREKNNFFSDSRIATEIQRLFDSYAEALSGVPANYRRYLLFTEEVRCKSEKVVALPFHLKETPFHFPSGHPRTETLYVVHPHRHNYYIPFDNYDFELFSDEIKEFAWLMENLGAKTISYTDKQDIYNSKTAEANMKIGAEGRYRAFSANGKYENSSDDEQYKKLISQYQEYSSFSIGNKPNIPVNLVWYPQRLDWQRKCESRMAGRLTSLTQTISTQETESISEHELTSIEAEVNTIVKSSIKGEYSSDKKISLKRSKAQSWEITVEFYPLDAYKTSSASKRMELTSPETNFPSSNPNNKVMMAITIFAVVIAIVAAICAIFM